MRVRRLATASRDLRGMWLTRAMSFALASLATIGMGWSPPAEAQSPTAAQRCEALAELRVQGAEITRAEMIPAVPAGSVTEPVTEIPLATGLPGHCRVEGMIDRRIGADDVEYGIGFALVLPDNWNRRLLYHGGGGFNGSIPEPWGLFATGGNPALSRGFAVVSTDSGHKGQHPFDVAFIADQQAAIDFAFNAVPTVTQLAKELTARYFGRAPHHSYSLGCSTGGREGMFAAQRYPTLFDGIIAGAPAMRTGATRLAGWNARIAFNRIAPRDSEGKPLAREAFPEADQRLLSAAVVRQCDALDGLADGLIMNAGACNFDPGVLQCRGDKAASCLSQDQVGALRTAFGETRDARGSWLYAAFPYDLGLLGDRGGNVFGRVPTAATGPYDSPPTPFEFDFAEEIERLRTNGLQILSDTDKWIDLGTFYRRGGKILFVHGASDPWFSVLDTEDYVRRLNAANPGFDSSRFYSAPGMGHCAGGGLERFDMLTAMVEWVENGVAPGAIVARGGEGTRAWKGGTRPLCPWPQHAHDKGTGDTREATSFECRDG